MIPPGVRHRDAAHEVPLHQVADVDGDVALGKLQRLGDVVEREGMILEKQDGEDAPLKLREHAGGRRRRTHPFDEDCSGLVHGSLVHVTYV